MIVHLLNAGTRRAYCSPRYKHMALVGWDCRLCRRALQRAIRDGMRPQPGRRAPKHPSLIKAILANPRVDIIRVREAFGWGLVELARKLGIWTTTLSDAESGKRQFAPAIAWKFKQLTDVSCPCRRCGRAVDAPPVLRKNHNCAVLTQLGVRDRQVSRAAGFKYDRIAKIRRGDQQGSLILWQSVAYVLHLPASTFVCWECGQPLPEQDCA